MCLCVCVPDILQFIQQEWAGVADPSGRAVSAVHYSTASKRKKEGEGDGDGEKENPAKKRKEE